MLFVYQCFACMLLEGLPQRMHPERPVMRGYVRLYREHPFRDRQYNDREIQAMPLRERITHSEPAHFIRDPDGWWLGFYDEWGTRADASISLMKLADSLMPRRYTPEEFAAWREQALQFAVSTQRPYKEL